MGWSAWGAICIVVSLLLFAVYEAKSKASDYMDDQ